MSPSPVPSLVKGSAIREFVLWYEAEHGRDYLRDMTQRISGEHREYVYPERAAFGLVATEWYPSALVFALLDAVALGRSDEEMSAIVEAGTSFAVRRLSRGLYQFLFRMVASPGLYARHIQKAWNLLHNTGVRRIVIEREGLADSTIHDWPGHHRWLCEISTATMRSVFSAMGCREVRLERLSCVSSGAPLCRAKLGYYDP